MRRMVWWPLSVLLMLAATAAGAQVPNSPPNDQPSDSSPAAGTASGGTKEAPAAPGVLHPGVTISGKPPHAERPLPKLRPDEFTHCMNRIGFDANLKDPSQFLFQSVFCERQLNWEKHVVLEDCLNRNGNTAAPRIIQACTESLQRDLVDANERYFLLASRADAYFAHGDPQHALGDLSAAIKLAPDNPALYYNRGVVFAAQSDDDAALRDFDAAMSINSKLVPVLSQRAKIYEARGNFSGALADYTEAISLQPKAALLWSDRGYVDLRDHGYESAVKDEAQAIQLDPKLARAYYLRSVAFGNLGDRVHAVSDLQTAVGLDPSLAGYVTIKGKTVSIGLPPL